MPMPQSDYFLYHSIGQYPQKEKDLAGAMSEFAAHWAAADTAQWDYVLGKRQAFIDRWSALINAGAGTVTTSENVTSALLSLVTSLPARSLKGKRVLVAADCFPSLHFLLTGLAPRLGFRLDTVPMRQGASWVEDEDFLDQWGPDVGLALITWITSTSSHRCDLNGLVAHGRKMGSIVGVDITQGAGLLPYDAQNPKVDFTISTSLKWLCGTPGAGILYVASPLLHRCEPELRGWFSQENPFSWDLDAFRFAPDARRFDNGTPSIVASLATLPALEWHARQDSAEMLATNRRMCEALFDGLGGLGLKIVTPRAVEQRGGSVMAIVPSDIAAGEVIKALARQNIYADARSQTIRFSPGPITTDGAVDRLLGALAKALR